jgi:hypothetical protein
MNNCLACFFLTTFAAGIPVSVGSTEEVNKPTVDVGNFATLRTIGSQERACINPLTGKTPRLGPSGFGTLREADAGRANRNSAFFCSSSCLPMSAFATSPSSRASSKNDGSSCVAQPRVCPRTSIDPSEEWVGPRIFHSRHFQIPVLADVEIRNGLKQINIFLSTDEGKSWKLIKKLSRQQEFFLFTAPGDGAYWFAVQAVDKAGNKDPKNARLLTPAQKMVILGTEQRRVETSERNRTGMEKEAAEDRQCR